MFAKRKVKSEQKLNQNVFHEYVLGSFVQQMPLYRYEHTYYPNKMKVYLDVIGLKKKRKKKRYTH